MRGISVLQDTVHFVGMLTAQSTVLANQAFLKVMRQGHANRGGRLSFTQHLLPSSPPSLLRRHLR